MQGTYRDTCLEIDIAHTVVTPLEGIGQFDPGDLDIRTGIVDWSISFVPDGGSPKKFRVPAANTFLLNIRGKNEPGQGVISGGGEQITITTDDRLIKIFLAA